MKNKQINKWFGLLGFLGFLCFIPKHNGDPNWLFVVFFSFFSYYLWAPVYKQKYDERMRKIINKVQQIMNMYLAIVTFGILFMLDRNIASSTILLVGTILYTSSFFIKPLIILKLGKNHIHNS